MSDGMTFHDYMRAYGEDHQNPANKLCHMIGIPIIVSSLPLIPTLPPVGISLFATGWGLQFLGHFFEGKKPSFTNDWKYLAIGPVWATVEWVELLTGKRLYEVEEAQVRKAPVTNGAGHATAATATPTYS
jgi:uncharacterized membrane protein YGL010W